MRRTHEMTTATNKLHKGYYVTVTFQHTHLVSVQPAADGAGLLGAQVERHVLHVRVVLTELKKGVTHGKKAWKRKGRGGYVAVSSCQRNT